MSDIKLPTAIRLVDPTTLNPAPVNPRTHSPEQIKRIEASIAEFGWTNPILVDAAGHVVAGHARQQAAINLGLAEVPVIDVGYLTPEQVRAYVIADNKLALDAGWDAAALKAELDALDALGYDTALTGFTGAEIDELLAGLDGVEVVEDVPPEPPPVAVSRRGDLWLCGRHRVLCGDSTNAEDVARVMAGEKAALCVTDPPYGVNFTNAKANIAADMSYAVIPAFFGLAVDQMLPGKAMLFFGGEINYTLYQALFNRELRIMPKMLFWRKQQFVLRHHDYHSQFECIFYGWTPGGDAATRWCGDRKQSDVWDVAHDATTSEKEHITQKPVELFAIPIRNHTREDELCLEPFFGSGSQLIAAEQLNRRCFGLEIEPRYVDVSVQRRANLTHDEPTLDGNGRTYTAVAAERLGAGP